jgi:serine-type D-Ala-D-Ala carboxypeptidase/endopeptidase (penicillin-binding protein 4)
MEQIKLKSFIRILILSTFLYVGTASHHTYAMTGLESQISELIKNDPVLKGAVTGVSIRSGQSGEILYEHQGDIRLRPASNMKLFTAAAALSVLGENYTFKTELLTDGPFFGNMIMGNLYLKGKGDPTLLKEDFDDFADQLIEKGINVIQGNLIGDDSWFDDVRYPIDLPWSDEQAYYGAQISALTASPDSDYDSGTVVVHVVPAKKIGQRAKITVSPQTAYVNIVNKVKTVDSKGKKEIVFNRGHGTNIIEISGSIPVKSKKISEWVAVWNPTGYTVDLLKRSLAERGIIISGIAKEGITPKTATLIASHSSMTLSEILVPFMKLSNNIHAETFIKEMGKVKKGEGSWEKGLEVLETHLVHLGVDTNSTVIRDGSGVSHINLVPANEISKLLFNVQNEKWFPVFLQALPISGVREKMKGGSLRNRLHNTRGKVFAKTGTLSTVSSLSGYVRTNNGETLIFSILLNNLLDEDKGKEVEDKLVTILANS